MSGFSEIVDSLELKFKKLFHRLEQAEKDRQALENEISKCALTIKRQQDEITDLKNHIESLKIANSLLGSDENKRETKLKINSLIREIDYCIAQLSD